MSEKNSALEQDFENEINKKNKNSKEIGQIINAINNIFAICRAQQQKRGKLKNLKVEDVTERTENLVPTLIAHLEMSSEVVEDLVEVFKILDSPFDQDKAYSEGVFGPVKPAGSALGPSTAKPALKPAAASVANDTSSNLKAAKGGGKATSSEKESGGIDQ